jgi:hypothetical protein
MWSGGVEECGNAGVRRGWREVRREEAGKEGLE